MSRYLRDLFGAQGDLGDLSVLLKITVIVFVVTGLRSLLATLPAYLVFWRLLRERLHHRRIQQRFPAAFRLWNEFKWSLSTFVVYTVLGVAAYGLFKAGTTQVYWRVSDHGWGYFAFSNVVVILVHDAYFYWTHRLLHWKPMFKYVHRVHHLSVNPSPWAAFSFHPIEAAISFGILPIMMIAIPLHVVTLKIFFWYMTLMNVLGHLGYEPFPRGFTRHWLSQWHNTSTHHNLHHSKVHCNYSLYFNWWDRWMGTNHVRYHKVYDEVTSRPSPRAARTPRAVLVRGGGPAPARRPGDGFGAEGVGTAPRHR